MKELYRISFYLIILLLVLVSFFESGCKKFVTIPPPQDQLVSSAVFADSSDATAAVLGIYIGVMNVFGVDFANGGVTLYSGLAADELYPNTGNSDDNEFYGNAISSSSIISSGFWVQAYQWIYQCNACIEGLSSTTAVSTSCKNELMGEALLSRAFFYFNMVNLWGGVPLVTTTSYQVNETMPRSSQDSIYLQIVKDLKAAQSLLPGTYFSTGKTRPNQYSATALLAKVYLHLNQWKDAQNAASIVINSGLYSLDTLNGVFLPNSNEAIW